MQSNDQNTNATPTLNSSLDEWLTYMYGIHVSAIDLGLSRVKPVFDALAINKADTFIFTVAGTNGKGSTTATIATICQTAGYKTALYQSPHLLVFNERIKINNQCVDDTTLIQAFNRVETARLGCNVTLSFFEMTTLAALLIFAEAKCDVWVLEIGLGGRLDVVNIIDPDLAVITNIGIDHTDWLGDTREQIGVEKAGILRPGITLIYGEADMPATIPPLITQHQATLLQYGRDFSYYQTDPQASTWQYSNAAITLTLPRPSLSIHNSSIAISAVIASPLNINQAQISDGLTTVKLAGRFDKRHMYDRQWVFDVAHNTHGMAFLFEQLIPYWQSYQQQYPKAQLQLIFSMLADKDIKSVLHDLQQLSIHHIPISQVYSAAINHPRGTEVLTLQQLLTAYFPTVYIADSLAEATSAAIAQSHTNDMILVCGSFHTISEVLMSPAFNTDKT